MTAWRILPAFVAALAFGNAARADVVSERADAITMTTYSSYSTDVSDLMDMGSWAAGDGLTLISETRNVDLPAGETVIRFRGVASTIVAQTADIQGLPAEHSERNFDYDLLGPGSLIAKSIGATVRLVRTDPATGRETTEDAVIRSGPAGAFLQVNGKTEALGCSGLPERLVFDNVPEGLTETPTLSVRVEVPKAGHYTLKLSYLMTGVQWTADYLAQVSADGRKMHLTGWVTLSNASETSFVNVPTEFVAGRINQTYEDEPARVWVIPKTPQCWPTSIEWGTYPRKAIYQSTPVTAVGQQELKYEGTDDLTSAVVVTASRIADPRLLGDYQLYQLPEPTTVAARQTKQVQFLDLDNVAFEKVYYYNASDDIYDDEPPKAELMYRLKNESANGLGKPLPSGRFAVMTPGPGGELLFAGQGSIKDTPVGGELEIGTGGGLNIAIDRQLLETRTIGKERVKRRRDTREYTIQNNKPVAIQFEFGHAFGDGTRIVSESRSHVMIPGGAMWAFALKPGESVTLHYTVEFNTYY